MAGHSVESEVKVDVRGRWDALALSEVLIPFHSFLVQHTTDRWVVHAHLGDVETMAHLLEFDSLLGRLAVARVGAAA